MASSVLRTTTGPWGALSPAQAEQVCPVVGEALLRWASHLDELSQRRLRPIFEHLLTTPTTEASRDFRLRLFYCWVATSLVPRWLEKGGYIRQARQLEQMRFTLGFDSERVVQASAPFLQTLAQRLGGRARSYLPVRGDDEVAALEAAARRLVTQAGVPFFCQSLVEHGRGHLLLVRGAIGMDAVVWNAVLLQLLSADDLAEAERQCMRLAQDCFRSSLSVLHAAFHLAP